MERAIKIAEPSASFPGLGVSTDQGLLQWISAVDHKMIGIMYLLVSLLFFVLGGAEALLMRVQLALPLNHFLGPETYNEFFTMHGTTMIFFVAMPADGQMDLISCKDIAAGILYFPPPLVAGDDDIGIF